MNTKSTYELVVEHTLNLDVGVLPYVRARTMKSPMLCNASVTPDKKPYKQDRNTHMYVIVKTRGCR